MNELNRETINKAINHLKGAKIANTDNVVTGFYYCKYCKRVEMFVNCLCKECDWDLLEDFKKKYE